jgi:hypothetical protein
MFALGAYGDSSSDSDSEKEHEKEDSEKDRKNKEVLAADETATAGEATSKKRKAAALPSVEDLMAKVDVPDYVKTVSVAGAALGEFDNPAATQEGEGEEEEGPRDALGRLEPTREFTLEECRAAEAKRRKDGADWQQECRAKGKMLKEYNQKRKQESFNVPAGLRDSLVGKEILITSDGLNHIMGRMPGRKMDQRS